MNILIRRTIRNNPYLYKLWINYYKNNNIEFPNKKHKLFVTGFPRSGNTLSFEILKLSHPTISFVGYIQTVASIKIAIKYNIPILLLIREPLDAISSYLLRSNLLQEKNGIEIAIDDYTTYHKYIKNNVDESKYQVFLFNDLKNNPNKFIRIINDKLNTKSLLGGDEALQKATSLMKNENKDILKKTLPNKKKEEEKSRLKIILNSNPRINDCIELYNFFKRKV